MMKKFSLLLLSFLLACCTTIKDPFYKDILDNAQHDIEVDSVKHFTGGLEFVRPVISGDSVYRETASFDSIEIKSQLIQKTYKKYGLYKKNLGCVIGDKQTLVLGKKYRKVTDPYLEKRNGKDWRKKIEKELDSLIEL